jgi:uncharacterized hydrophobic protein (TIGR00271 family)
LQKKIEIAKLSLTAVYLAFEITKKNYKHIPIMRQFQLVNTILGYLNLSTEVDDFDEIHDNIVKDLAFKGTNLYILVFAILIASVGLNMNSTAVIIGAMLISPLMGPINGMGYSLATYDFRLFQKALKNFIFAVIASLITSTIYFAITPISTAHSEILSRTSPSIFDVLIALFGGLAGIVAISSKQKGNVIPGVAIATALMPPLCTAGYGLATSQWSFFFGAFFLFTINTVFIAISTVIISQLLRFPIRTLIDENQKTKITRWISIVSLLIIIPSLYFGYLLVQKEKFLENANAFVNNVSVIEGNYLLKNEVDPKTRIITLVYGGSTLTEVQKKEIIDKANLFKLKGTKLKFQQGLSFDFINKKDSEVDNLKSEINRLSAAVKEKEMVLDSIASSKTFGKQLLDELKSLYPNVSGCSVSEATEYNKLDNTSKVLQIVVVETTGKSLRNDEKQKILTWLKTRLKEEDIKVFYDTLPPLKPKSKK